MSRYSVRKLTLTLKKHFGGKVQSEQVAPGKFRFAIVSKRFEGVPHMTRQDRIWEVVEQTLSRDAKLDLTLILAYAPSELKVSA